MGLGVGGAVTGKAARAVTGGTQSSVWMDISLASGFGSGSTATTGSGTTGAGGTSGSSATSVSTPLLSYEIGGGTMTGDEVEGENCLNENVDETADI